MGQSSLGHSLELVGNALNMFLDDKAPIFFKTAERCLEVSLVNKLDSTILEETRRGKKQ